MARITEDTFSLMVIAALGGAVIFWLLFGLAAAIIAGFVIPLIFGWSEHRKSKSIIPGHKGRIRGQHTRK